MLPLIPLIGSITTTIAIILILVGTGLGFGSYQKYSNKDPENGDKLAAGCMGTCVTGLALLCAVILVRRMIGKSKFSRPKMSMFPRGGNANGFPQQGYPVAGAPPIYAYGPQIPAGAQPDF